MYSEISKRGSPAEGLGVFRNRREKFEVDWQNVWTLEQKADMDCNLLSKECFLAVILKIEEETILPRQLRAKD